MSRLEVSVSAAAESAHRQRINQEQETESKHTTNS
jgi:hypothetical protein